MKMKTAPKVNRCTRHKKKVIPADQAGFTLIEVMVAMVVLVVGVLGVLYMQLATVKGNSNAIGISRAVHEASAGLDMIESLDFSGTSALASGTSKTIGDLFGTGVDDKKMTDNMMGTISYDVVDLNAATLKTEFGYTDNFPGAQGKKVTVSSTQNVSGHSRTVEIEYIKIDI